MADPFAKDMTPKIRRFSWPWALYFVLTVLSLFPLQFGDWNWADALDMVISLPSLVALFLITFRRRWGPDRLWTIYAIAFPVLDIGLNLISLVGIERIAFDVYIFLSFLFAVPLYVGIIQHAFKSEALYWSPVMHFNSPGASQRRLLVKASRRLRALWVVCLVMAIYYVLSSSLSFLGSLYGYVEAVKEFGVWGPVLACIDLVLSLVLLWGVTMTAVWPEAIILALLAFIAPTSLADIDTSVIFFVLFGVAYWPIQRKLMTARKQTPTPQPPVGSAYIE